MTTSVKLTASIVSLAFLFAMPLPAQTAAAHWVATWATSPASYMDYSQPGPPAFPPGAPTAFAPAQVMPDLSFPFPGGNINGARNQTFRSIVKPDLWGNQMRFRFSNVFGTAPVTFDDVTVALQEYSGNVVAGTMMQVTFGGNKAVTIAPGQRTFSDGISLPWVTDTSNPLLQGRNLAVSYSVKGDSGPMTLHYAAYTTSYVTPPQSGDHAADQDVLAFEFTTTSMFFLDAVDVMAPQGTLVVCAFGDSITDGVHSTMNGDDRWPNVLSHKLHEGYGNKVSVVNAGIGGNQVVGAWVASGSAGPPAVDRLDRDVLGLSGLTHVIWLEGINDLGVGNTTAAVIAGYQNVVARLHAAGVKVYGGTLTSALGMENPQEGWYPGYKGGEDNGPVIDAARKVLNEYIRTSGLFDGVIDFDAATLDPTTGNMKAEFLPNSTYSELPWDYLHPNHAGYIAMGEAVWAKPLK